MKLTYLRKQHSRSEKIWSMKFHLLGAIFIVVDNSLDLLFLHDLSQITRILVPSRGPREAGQDFLSLVGEMEGQKVVASIYL